MPGYILFDSRANDPDDERASILEAFAATDDAAAIKHARHHFGRQEAVLFRVRPGPEPREIEEVGNIDHMKG